MNINTDTNIEFLSFGLFKAPDKNWVHMSRSQDSWQIFCVTKGILYISDDRKDYTVSAGEYLVMPPCSNQHGWKASQCEFYYFHFYEKSGNADRQVVQGTYGDLNRIEALYAMLSYERRRKDNNNHIIALILCELTNPLNDDRNSESDTLCERILAYMKYAQAEHLDIGYLAEKFMYHEKYLSQKFKKETGMSLKKHVKAELMGRARHLLAVTPLSITEISDRLGYSDVHSFSHVFKREEGISPREYRKNVQGKNV